MVSVLRAIPNFLAVGIPVWQTPLQGWPQQLVLFVCYWRTGRPALPAVPAWHHSWSALRSLRARKREQR